MGNIMGAFSLTPGLAGIEGPYQRYSGNGVVIGPHATSPTATQWGDLHDCHACHEGKRINTDISSFSSISSLPVYCTMPPCQFDNGITGAAISTGPYVLPDTASARFGTFLGLDHSLAWSNNLSGPWTVGTPYTTGQLMNAKISTVSSMYTENPVVTRIKLPDGGLGYVAVFDTVSPSGGWVEVGGQWVSGVGRGESYGFGVSFSLNGEFWSRGVDVALPGGCRTPLGLIQEDTDSFSLLFTRRTIGDGGVTPECNRLVLPPGSRGDAANGRSMCANLYAARFNVSWGEWS